MMTNSLTQPIHCVVSANFQSMQLVIAAYVVRSLRKKVKCVECLAACITIPVINSNAHSRIALITKKSCEGLAVPSDSVVKIYTTTEESFRNACNVNLGRPPVEENFRAVLTMAIIKKTNAFIQ